MVGSFLLMVAVYIRFVSNDEVELKPVYGEVEFIQVTFNWFL